MPEHSHLAAVALLHGHVERIGLETALQEAEANACPSCPVIIDCLEMQTYDPQARQALIAWHRRNPTRRVAIVTRKRTWHMVVSAMSLASGRPMRAFDTVDEARAWLGLPPQPRASSA